jgi:hypothetical protein
MEQYFAPLSEEQLCWLIIIFGVALFLSARRIETLFYEWRRPVRKLYTAPSPKEEVEELLENIFLEAQKDYYAAEEVGFEKYLEAHLTLWGSKRHRDTLTTEEMRKVRDKISFCLVIVSMYKESEKSVFSEKRQKLIDIRTDIVRMVGPV